MRNRSNPFQPGSGDDYARMDSPTGLKQRAIDAAEFAPGYDDRARGMLTEIVENDDDPLASAFVLAGSDPAYRTAFSKAVRSPQGFLLWTAQEREAYARVEAARAALSETGANGGYLVPFTLDPSVVLTNVGAANPFREVSRKATTATVTWNGVASSGITAQWLAEGAVASDASPTFSQLPFTPAKAAAWVFGSYEIIADTDIGSQLIDLLADARNNLESAAFATGTGTNQPKGIVTAATTTVTTASVATYALADVYSLHQNLPARSRQGKSPAVVGNVAILNKTRQFDTAGGSSYWTNLGQGQPETVLGMRLFEASSMVSTTTTGSKILVAGDFDKFQIVDRLGMTLLYEPMVKDQATARPTGQAGWFAYWRVTSDCLDPTAFRTLVVQ